ncbi:MAG: hypothetical protein QXD10_09965 [Metallosphaera sp.]|uniref:hypothetical protein n=1 Tax=Metallosphaera sp. TaxID=2020860 RepID=UPI00315ED1D8
MNNDEIERLFQGDLRDLYYLYSKVKGEEVIKWMKERPKQQVSFHEEGGDQEIVVVIPTADSNGDLARRAREVYRNAHIIFVESRGPFFNYAHSVNEGIKRANELKPSWIVVSNDDVTYADSIAKLKDELSVVSNAELIMASPGKYHTYPVLLVKVKESFIKGMRVMGPLLAPAEVYGKVLRHRERLGVEVITVIESMVGPFKRLAGEVVARVINAGSFMILKPESRLMDETFINSHEDLVFSLVSKSEIVNYKVREMRGASLGFGRLRFARTFVNEIYFNHLIRSGLLKGKMTEE